MAFLDTRFPERIALQAVGGPGYSTQVVALRSGAEARNQNLALPRHAYQFAHKGLAEAQHVALLTLFHAAAGQFNSFRVKDWGDFRLAHANGGLLGRHVGAALIEAGTFGIGHGVPTYQVFKRYSLGGVNRDRRITKLVSNTLAVLRNGGAVTVGGGAGQISIDLLTGRVTFVADQTRAISSISVGATTQLTLASAFSPNAAVGGRVFITGVTGTAAALLNNLSHAVTAVATNVVTVSTVTTGLTATGGTAALYPQPAESLTVAGEFDVPCRFSGDLARWSIDATNSIGPLYWWDGIELLEVIGE